MKCELLHTEATHIRLSQPIVEPQAFGLVSLKSVMSSEKLAASYNEDTSKIVEQMAKEKVQKKN